MAVGVSILAGLLAAPVAPALAAADAAPPADLGTCASNVRPSVALTGHGLAVFALDSGAGCVWTGWFVSNVTNRGIDEYADPYDYFAEQRVVGMQEVVLQPGSQVQVDVRGQIAQGLADWGFQRACTVWQDDAGATDDITYALANPFSAHGGVGDDEGPPIRPAACRTS
jgi:hypothetical protein